MIVGNLLEQADVNYGFDAQTATYTDMVKAGIIDPTKVVRLALQGAASVAALLITTEAMVSEKRNSYEGHCRAGVRMPERHDQEPSIVRPPRAAAESGGGFAG